MQTFIEQFKTKARNKNLTRADMFSLCVYKAVRAKSENKKAVLYGLLRKAFTPGEVCAHRPHPYWTVRLVEAEIRYELRSGYKYDPESKKFVDQGGSMLGIKLDQLFTEEERTTLNELMNSFNWKLS